MVDGCHLAPCENDPRFYPARVLSAEFQPHRVDRISLEANVPFFSNADIPIAFETLAWVQTFLVDPNPSMKRSRDSGGESICPFAKPVLQENSLYMAFHHEVNGKSAELIESIVLGYREPFKKSTPFHQGERFKKALLVIFPEIPPAETGVLDIVHSNVKAQFVHDGLMVAQCHSRCDGGSGAPSSAEGVHVAAPDDGDTVHGAARHSFSRRQRILVHRVRPALWIELPGTGKA